jgi:hypothetical protein
MERGNLLIKRLYKTEYVSLKYSSTANTKTKNPDSYFQKIVALSTRTNLLQKEGFADILTDYANISAHHARFPYEFEKQFLSKVDLTNVLFWSM